MNRKNPSKAYMKKEKELFKKIHQLEGYPKQERKLSPIGRIYLLLFIGCFVALAIIAFLMIARTDELTSNPLTYCARQVAPDAHCVCWSNESKIMSLFDSESVKTYLIQ